MDSQDQAIVDALRSGKSDDEIKSEFGVDDAKLEQLRPVAAEPAKDESAGEGEPEGDKEEGADDEGRTDDSAGADGEDTL